MNKDFEKVIRDMMESGKSMEDVIDALGKTWDQVKKSEAEQAIIKWRAEVDTLFEEQWTHQHTEMDPEVIIQFLFYVLSHKHPEWSLKDIQNGIDATKNAMQVIVKAIGKEPGEMLNVMGDELNSMMSKFFNELHGRTPDPKANPKAQTKEKKVKDASDKPVFTVDEDLTLLKNFFDLFGL